MIKKFEVGKIYLCQSSVLTPRSFDSIVTVVGFEWLPRDSWLNNKQAKIKFLCDGQIVERSIEPKLMFKYFDEIKL